jgi:hypothetical protein
VNQKQNNCCSLENRRGSVLDENGAAAQVLVHVPKNIQCDEKCVGVLCIMDVYVMFKDARCM